MADIVVIGKDEFTLGFRLAGITRTFEVDEKPELVFRDVMQDHNVGIIITEDKTVEKLPIVDKEKVENSAKPVVVVVSTEDYSAGLRSLIKQSIGVDIWSSKEN